MTKSILGVLAALVLAAPGAAEAHTTIIEPVGSHFPYQRWVNEAAVPTPSVTLTVVEEPCPGEEDLDVACTIPEEATIWMDPRRVIGRHGWWAREVFYHEMGHNFDADVLSEAERAGFARLRGTRRQWEYPEESTANGNFGLEEVFADAYAGCALDLPDFLRGTITAVAPRSCRFIDAAWAKAQ